MMMLVMMMTVVVVVVVVLVVRILSKFLQFVLALGKIFSRWTLLFMFTFKIYCHYSSLLSTLRYQRQYH